jgi:hypothetical protein
MKIVLSLFLVLNCFFCAYAKKFTVHNNIAYLDPSTVGYDKSSHSLDVYVPNERLKGKHKSKGKVFVFIHGGAWKGGSKDSPRHRAVGKAFASNGILTVVINYRLWPETKYYGMADDCARAVTWVKKNIAQYGGDPTEIFVSGHSSGGHLAALITTDSSYFLKAGIEDPVKGCILNDPFGLNMFEYLATGNPVDRMLFNIIFTDQPTEWMKGSPYYHINKDNVRYYMIHGAETMSFVKTSSKEFHERNRFVGNYSHSHVVQWRTHIPMLDLFCHKHSRELKKVVAFIMEK